LVAIIKTEKLTKSYGSHRGIVDVDLEVQQGEVFGFLGPNGAGKTTTIRVLLDLIRPTSGKAFVFGIETTVDSVSIHRRVGYLPGAGKRFLVSGPTKLFLDRWYPLSLEDKNFLKAKRAVCCLTYGADDVLLSGADTTARSLGDIFTFLKVPVTFVHASAWKKGDIRKSPAALKRAYEAGKQLVK